MNGRDTLLPVLALLLVATLAGCVGSPAETPGEAAGPATNASINGAPTAGSGAKSEQGTPVAGVGSEPGTQNHWPFAVVASHASASVQWPPEISESTIRVRVQGLPDGPFWNDTVDVRSDGSSVLGFLEPNREYAMLADTKGGTFNASFRTLPSPYQWAAAGDALLAPGSQICYDNGCATLAFIYRDASNDSVYGLAAGHSVPGVGPVYSGGLEAERLLVGHGHAWNNSDGGPGILEYTEWHDWAIIRFEPQIRDQISPSVIGWSGPTGVMASRDTNRGDVLCITGNAYTFTASVLHDVTTSRCGSAMPTPWQPTTLLIPIEKGDSGAPVIHHETGHALGVVTNALSPAYGVYYPLCAAHEEMRQHGLNLRIVTAPYEPSATLHPKVEPAIDPPMQARC